MKSRKTTQKFFAFEQEWILKRSCHATHHSQPVPELRISHKFSPVLPNISQPIQVIINNTRNFNPLISKFLIKVNSILPFTERCSKCLVLTGVLQGASWAQKGYLQWSITGLSVSPRRIETLHIYTIYMHTIYSGAPVQVCVTRVMQAWNVGAYKKGI